MRIPVIDLFAGPGGLAEGFSSLFDKNDRVFDIRLSIEKDFNAHETLEFRSFYRQFPKNKIPSEYYDVLKESDLKLRNKKKDVLYDNFKNESKKAKKEAWKAELGHKDFPEKLVDNRIKAEINGEKNWLLIGGPPCQAYSLAGRSRVGGIDKEDGRVYLYKEYLRIIAVHHPAIFVMENVKGLLSAKVNGEKVFEWILNDLQDPASIFKYSKSPKYKVYSLSSDSLGVDIFDNPTYKDYRDYLINSEDYGIPQKRHRVILLGIREDINAIPSVLDKSKNEVLLESIIGDLPRLRSGVGRSILSSKTDNGKKKRVYKGEENTNENWERIINGFKDEILTWKGFTNKDAAKHIKPPLNGVGSEFVKGSILSKNNPLKEWYLDSKLEGACNHESRKHLLEDLKRYLFASIYSKKYKRFPRLHDYEQYSAKLMPDHASAKSGKFTDRFRVQLENKPATTITSHISKDGHYFIHYDPEQCRSLTVREAARVQTFPDNYLFCGPRTAQYHQVGNAVPPYLSFQIAKIVFELLKKENNGN